MPPRPPSYPTPLGALCEGHGIRNINVRHVHGDPRQRADMQRLIDVSGFDAALVLRGGSWQGVGR